MALLLVVKWAELDRHNLAIRECQAASFYGLDLDFDDLVIVVHLCPEHERQAFGGDAALAAHRPRLALVEADGAT
jgi:hypothetical protein